MWIGLNKHDILNYRACFLGRIGGAKLLYRLGIASSFVSLLGIITPLLWFSCIPLSLFIISILCLIIDGFIRCISSNGSSFPSNSSRGFSSDFIRRLSSSFSIDTGRLRTAGGAREAGSGGGSEGRGECPWGRDVGRGGGQEARLKGGGGGGEMGAGREEE